MATKFFLIETAGVDGSGDIDRLLSLTAGDGSGLKTDVANTTASGTVIQMTDTAGGTAVRWISNPLNAVTIASSSGTGNVWMSENNMSANVQGRIEWGKYDGSTFTVWVQKVVGVELPVTTRAAQNFAINDGVGSHSIAAGERLYVMVQGLNIGTMGGGFTFDLGYNGTTGAADGDSWVQFTETITEQVASATSLLIPHRHRGLIVR